MKPAENRVMLDLDDPSTLVPALYQLLDAPGMWPILNEDFAGNCALFDELAHTPEYLTTDLVRELRAEADRVIRAEYTSVAAYHACCPADRKSYTERGLLRTNRQLLFNLTREAFGPLPNLETTFELVCDKYLKWYDGTVGLFLSAHEETSWYRASCFLGKMADALGGEGQDLLSAFLAGAYPTIVKCMLPLGWLDHRMRAPAMHRYASAALQKMILIRSSPEDTTHNFGALGLKSDLPPEMIIGFMDPPSG